MIKAKEALGNSKNVEQYLAYRSITGAQTATKENKLAVLKFVIGSKNSKYMSKM